MVISRENKIIPRYYYNSLAKKGSRYNSDEKSESLELTYHNVVTSSEFMTLGIN